MEKALDNAFSKDGFLSNPDVATPRTPIVYSPGLFQQLDLYQTELSDAFKPLQEAIKDNRNLEVRKQYFAFRDALRQYLSSCSTQVFAFLLERYGSDLRYEDRYMATLKEEMEMERFVQTASMFFCYYNSPSAKFDQSFHKKLHSLVTVLNYRIHRMKEQVYPLLP